MDNILRVCIVGRHYDIPTQEISQETLIALNHLIDESQNINPKDLLKAFLEASEISNTFKTTIQKANQILESNKNS